MYKVLVSLVCILTFTQARAGLMDPPGAPGLSEGDMFFGAKVALGNVYGSSVGLVLDFEYGLKEGFLNIPDFPASLGVGATIGYSSYTEKFLYKEPRDQNYKLGTYNFKNYLFLGSLYYHIDLFKEANVDPYAVLHIGFNIDSEDKPLASPSQDNRYSGPVWGSAVGFRYHYSPKMSVSGEIGFGMGILRVGINYKI